MSLTGPTVLDKIPCNMRTLEILRAWRGAKSVFEKATLAEIDDASRALEYFEKQLGPGCTKVALDLAIEWEASTMKKQKATAKSGAGKEAR